MFTNWELTIFTVPTVATELAKHLTAGTITRGEGIWLGEVEASATVTILANDPAEIDRTLALAETIAHELAENYILASVREVSAALIELATRERFPLVAEILKVTAN